MNRRQFIARIVAAGTVATLLPASASEKKDKPDVILHRDRQGVMTPWPTPGYSIPPMNKGIPFAASEVLLWDRISDPYLPTYDIPTDRHSISFFTMPNREFAEINSGNVSKSCEYSITIPWATDDQIGETRDATLMRLLHAAAHSSLYGQYKNLSGLMDTAMKTIKHYGFRPKNIILNRSIFDYILPWYCGDASKTISLRHVDQCPRNCVFLLAEPEWVGVYATKMTSDGIRELPQWAMGVLNPQGVVKVELNG